MNFCNKLECLSLQKFFQPSLMLVGKAGAYLRVEQLKRTFTWVGSWPFLQTSDKDGKAWQGQAL
jgi:hypothetical protein